MAEKGTISVNGTAITAYRADPAGAPRGGLVLLQEIFGVNAHIRSVIDRYAGHGFSVIAPALFDLVERDVELPYDETGFARGRALKEASPPDSVLPIIDAALAEARQATGKAGVIGYCWGGLLVWLSAARLSPDCAVGYYGGGTADYLDEAPQCPIQLHFGDSDTHIPNDQVAALRQRYPALPVFVHEGAGHGFNCDVRADYHPEAAARAEASALAFFAEHLS